LHACQDALASFGLKVGDLDDVRLLLEFHGAAEPAPPVQRYGGTSGPAPMHKTSCTACGGRGLDRFRRVCSTCEGRGWRWEDSYVGPVGTLDTALVDRSRWVRCDGCEGEGRHRNGRLCRACQGKGGEYVTPSAVQAVSASSARGPQPGDALQVALGAGRASVSLNLRGSGSFDALDVALAELTPRERRLIAKGREELDDLECVYEQRAVRKVRDRMREQGPIRVPHELRLWQERARPAGVLGSGRWGNSFARKRRNALVYELRSEGLSCRQIGQRVGVHHTTVVRVLAGSVGAVSA
jgi:hypothetical protein